MPEGGAGREFTQPGQYAPVAVASNELGECYHSLLVCGYGKDASHIQPVHNAPQRAADAGNILWESSGVNCARGAADMTGWGKFIAQGNNAFDTAGIVMRECATAAAISALYAALLETPVAAIKNYIRYQKGVVSGEQAVMCGGIGQAAN